MPKTRMLVVSALVVALLGSYQTAHAAFMLVHDSIETLYDDGAGNHGTIVTNCAGLGCPSSPEFEFGNPSGLLADRQFKVQEEVRYDEGLDQTKITYTITNFNAGTFMT